WKLAVTETERGNFERAADLLAAARTCGRISPQGMVLLAELLATYAELPQAIGILEDMIRLQPGHADPYRRLIALLQRARAFGRAAEVIEEAAERWPNDWMLLLRFNRLPVEPAGFKRIFQRFAKSAKVAAQN